MDEKAIRGIPWTFLSYAGTKVVTVATTIVLARLLTPADFGLVALALLAVGLFGVLRDLGLGNSLIVRQEFDRQAQGTVLTMVLATGLAVTVLLALASPLIADFFDASRLTAVLLTLSPSIVIGSFAWFYEFILKRELRFRERFIALAAQTAVYAGLAIALAALGAGVWSLVVGLLAGNIAFAIAVVWLAPYRVRPRFEGSVARDALSTSKGFLAQGLAAFMQENLDYVIVGRVLNTTQVGFYVMAYRMADIPYWAVSDSVTTVTFPTFTRMRARGEDPVPVFLRTLRFVALVGCPLGIILSGAADPFVEALFGDKWLPMIGPLAVLGIWTAGRVIQGTVAWFLNSIEQASIVGALSVAVLVPLAPALVIAAEDGGITGVAWVMLGHISVLTIAVVAVAHRRGGVSVGAQLMAIWPALLACVPAWFATRLVADATASAPPLVALIAASAAGLAAYALALLAVDPGLPRSAMRQLAGTVRQRPTEAG